MKHLTIWLFLALPFFGTTQNLIVEEYDGAFPDISAFVSSVTYYLDGIKDIPEKQLAGSTLDSAALDKLKTTFQSTITPDYHNGKIKYLNVDDHPLRQKEKPSPIFRRAFFQKGQGDELMETLIVLEIHFKKNTSNKKYSIKDILLKKQANPEGKLYKKAKSYYEKLPQVDQAITDSIIQNKLIFVGTEIKNNNACPGDTIEVLFHLFVQKEFEVPAAKLRDNPNFDLFSTVPVKQLEEPIIETIEEKEYKVIPLAHFTMPAERPRHTLIDEIFVEGTVLGGSEEGATEQPKLKFALELEPIQLSVKICK